MAVKSQAAKAVTESTDVLTGIRERLGITDAGASADEILASLDAKLTVPEVQEGTALIDKTVLEDLTAKAQDGVKALAELADQRRSKIISDALEAGKITASTQEMWRAQLDRDEEGTGKLLEALAANVVPVEEIGRGVVSLAEVDAATNELYGRAFPSAKKEA